MQTQQKVKKYGIPTSLGHKLWVNVTDQPCQGPVSPAGYPGTAGGLTAAPDAQARCGRKQTWKTDKKSWKIMKNP